MDPVQELQQTCDKLGSAVKDLRDELERKVDGIGKSVKDALQEDKIGKIQQSIDDLCGTKTALEKRIKLAEEQKDRLDKVELQLKTETGHREEVERKLNNLRVSGGGAPEQKAAARIRHNLWLKSVMRAQMSGAVNLSAEQGKLLEEVRAEYKAMTLTDDTTGGYLAPLEYVQEIIKAVTEISMVRELVRVRTTAQKGIILSKRTGQFAARRTSETGTRTETTGLTYGTVEIDTPEMYAFVDMSEQNLEDSAWNMEEELRIECQEQFAVKEGQEFVTGTGIGELQGIITACNAGLIASTVSGTAAAIADSDGQANGLMNLFHALKTFYTRNAWWILNRVTLGAVRKLKDTQKQYIWQPGLAMGVPNTILGAPYKEVPDMPSEGANNFPIGFGDWQRAYTLLDRVGMSILRDPYTQATSGFIRFLMRRRVGGRVVLGEAVRLLKCST